MALKTEQRARIVSLRSLGRSYQKIGEEVGVSKDTVLKVCREEKDSVYEYRRDMLDEVAVAQRLLLRNRLQSLGEFAGRVEEELKGRKLEDVSTTALSRMYLETLRAIQEQAPLFAKQGWFEGIFTVEELKERGPLDFLL